MSLAFRLQPLAEVDVIDAWEWYEDQSAGLGDRFLSAVEAAIQRATRWPNAGTPALVDDNGGIVERKVAAHGFPFAVRYRVTADLLIVMAVYHQHRRPDFGRDRSP